MSEMMIEEVDSGMPHERKHFSEPQLEHKVGIDLLTAWPIKCAYAVQEMFQTERDYILSLENVLNGYRTPLVYHLRSDNQCHRIIQTLFGNIDAIYDLHRYLLKELKLQQGDPHEFGQVFVATKEKFKMYARYCTNYDAAVNCLLQLTESDKDLEHFLSACQSKLGHLLPLSSQLIKPVQRIMRYHIMLKEIVKHFDSNLHGYESLHAAHQTMLQIGDYINNVQKQKENAERIMDLQTNTSGLAGKDVKNLSAYGELIIENSCKVGFKSIPRQVVLFEKLLIILKKKDAKKYTYKGHVLASELQIDLKFCKANPSMLKVFSHIHHNHSYEIDLGSTRKQQQWLNKLHGLMEAVSQSNRSHVLARSRSSQSHKVKRQKLEAVDVKDGMDIPNPEALTQSSASLFMQQSKIGGGRRTYKRRNRNDIRSLFPEQGDSDEKRQAYSASSSDVTQSLPELDMMTTQSTVQQQEPVNLEEESIRALTDSLLSDGGADVETVVTKGGEVGGVDSRLPKSKLIRRTAIKVKKSRSISAGLSLMASSSFSLFRGSEDNEGASPPPLLDGASGMEESEPGLRDTSGVTIDALSSLDYSMTSRSLSNGKLTNGADLQTTPTTSETGDDLDEGELETDRQADCLPTRSLSGKRPKCISHDISHGEGDLCVEIVVGDDSLEFGDSCEKSTLGSREEMPKDEGNSEDWVDQAGGVGGGAGLMDLSGTDEPDASEVTEGEEDFMIYEDSSDSEEDEEEDLEKTANELESSLLEAVEIEEAMLQQEKETPGSPSQQSLPHDQVVPRQDTLNGNSNMQDSNSISSDPQLNRVSSLATFEFKHSISKDSPTDTYYTLPHKKAPFSSSLLSPSSTERPSPHRTGELSLSSIRRMEGFSRLLEFTRQQVCFDPEETCKNVSDLDVSQSLPVLSNFLIDDTKEDKELDIDRSLIAENESSIGTAAETVNAVAGTTDAAAAETENSITTETENSMDVASETANSIDTAAETDNFVNSTGKTENSIDAENEITIDAATELEVSNGTLAETENSIDAITEIKTSTEISLGTCSMGGDSPILHGKLDVNETEEIEQENVDLASGMEKVDNDDELCTEVDKVGELENSEVEFNDVTDVISESETVGTPCGEEEGEFGFFAYWSRTIRLHAGSFLPSTNTLVVIGVAVVVCVVYTIYLR